MTIPSDDFESSQRASKSEAGKRKASVSDGTGNAAKKKKEASVHI